MATFDTVTYTNQDGNTLGPRLYGSRTGWGVMIEDVSKSGITNPTHFTFQIASYGTMPAGTLNAYIYNSSSVLLETSSTTFDAQSIPTSGYNSYTFEFTGDTTITDGARVIFTAPGTDYDNACSGWNYHNGTSRNGTDGTKNTELIGGSFEDQITYNPQMTWTDDYVPPPVTSTTTLPPPPAMVRL